MKDHSKEGNSERKGGIFLPCHLPRTPLFLQPRAGGLRERDDEGGTLKYGENKKERVDGARLSLP